MAPAEALVEWQTSEIVKYLLEDEDGAQCRQFTACNLEVDGPPGSDDDDFDPVLIADRLKTVADSLNDDVRFKAALKELKEAAAAEAAELAFSQGVDALCQSQVARTAEVAPEVQLIKASVAFGLYVKKSCPDMKAKVHAAMTAFLNRRVGTWLTRQGGWNKVNVED